MNFSIVQNGKKEKPLFADKEYQIKLVTGRETDREQLMGMLRLVIKRRIRKTIFFNGFTQERFEELEISVKRNNELSILRKNIKIRYVQQNKDQNNSYKIENSK